MRASHERSGLFFIPRPRGEKRSARNECFSFVAASAGEPQSLSQASKQSSE